MEHDSTDSDQVRVLRDNLPIRLRKRCILGFFTHPGTLDDYLDLINDSIHEQQICTILYHNQHTLYCYFKSALLRQHYADKTIIADGMGIIFLYKLAGIPVTRDHRLTYVDFIMPMMKLAREKRWRVFHLGQKTDVQQTALTTIRDTVPGIEIEGHHGYFDQNPNSHDSAEVIRQINDYRADLVLVGFGTPNQEAWVHAHREKIDAPALLTCGACMEYVAGAVKTAPRWMGRVGLEWSFRLYDNPRRFAYRYTVQTLLLCGILCRNWVRLKFAAKDSVQQNS